MVSVRTALLACLLLAACDGNPLEDKGTGGSGGGGGETPLVVPEEVAQDMNGFTYSEGTLRIDMQGVSSSGRLATFTRAPALDLTNGGANPEYEAYVYQDTALTRSFLAYVARNSRGNVLAVAAADGGQFNEHNYGGSYVQLTAFTRPVTSDAPESGLFSYLGSYVGIFSPGEFADGSDPRPPELRPVEPWQVRGTVQVNGSFAHNMVEGGVTNRRLYTQDGTRITSIVIDDGNPSTTDDPIDTTFLTGLVLRETTITENGAFLGDVEYYGAPDVDKGDFGGAFGGVGATDVAGVLWVHPINGENGIWESGTFNLPRCGVAGSSPLCIPR